MNDGGKSDVPLKNTGVPINGLVLGIVMALGGICVSKRN